MFALSLSPDMRVLHATFDEFAPPEWPRVEALPDGDVTDYKYIDGQFVSDPLPKPEPPEPPEPPKPTDAEARIKALEDELAALRKAQFENI